MYYQFDEMYMLNSNTFEMSKMLRLKYPVHMMDVFPDSTGDSDQANVAGIADAIAINIRLTGIEIIGTIVTAGQEIVRVGIAAKRPADLAAWELCLRGFAHLQRYLKEDTIQAREMFAAALALDPDYARAYAGIAYSHIQDCRFGFSDDVEESERRKK